MPIIRLNSNQPADRFYRGGGKIRSFRSESAFPSAGDHVPEDWVGSTTTLFGEKERGLTKTSDGELLVDVVERDPEYWLGPEHCRKYGSDVMMLVKLLDAGQRLPVHVHPSRSFSLEHLGRRHGKAEAWMILDGGYVYLGFNRAVGVEELNSWVREQNVEGFLNAMHKVAVSAGDSVFVPSGMPHAIGEDVFLVEVQEPEDLSILLEWAGFDIDGAQEGHLGLGFDAALGAVDRRGISREALDGLIVRRDSGRYALAEGSEMYFRSENHKISSEATFGAGFSVGIVTDGAGLLRSESGQSLEVARGDTLLIPHGAGDFHLSGDAELIRCRPPE